jgi:hypothetical protein
MFFLSKKYYDKEQVKNLVVIYSSLEYKLEKKS